jgi:pyruvate-ferredoxin/flavodoxin oxidoreductase
VRGGHFISIVKNMFADQPREYTVIGIKHPLALSDGEDPDLRPQGAFSMRGHSVGGFGSVTTNKLIAGFVGELFNIYVQAYPKYGSEKKGLPTTYYLTVAEKHIRTHSERPRRVHPAQRRERLQLGNPPTVAASAHFHSKPGDHPQRWRDIRLTGRRSFATSG